MDMIQTLAYGKRVADFVEDGQLAAAMADAGLESPRFRVKPSRG